MLSQMFEFYNHPKNLFPPASMANYRCQVCRGKGDVESGKHKFPFGAVEQWEFDLKDRVQIFLGLLVLCPDCISARSCAWGIHRYPESHLEKIAHVRKLLSFDDMMHELIQKTFQLQERLRSESVVRWLLDLRNTEWLPEPYWKGVMEKHNSTSSNPLKYTIAGVATIDPDLEDCYPEEEIW